MTRSQTALMRRAGSASGVALTIPKHINEVACFEAGDSVCISSDEAGRITITKVESKLRLKKPLSKAEVEILRSYWSSGFPVAEAAAAVNVAAYTARVYYADFEKGIR